MQEESQGMYIAQLEEGYAAVELFKSGKVKISLNETSICLPVKTWVELAESQFRQPFAQQGTE